MIEIQWHPSSKELRRFGLIVIAGFCIMAGIFHWLLNEETACTVALIAGGALGLPALTGTVIALPGYWFWMGIAFVMGNIMNRVLLTILWVVLFVPIGMIRRNFFADTLMLKKPNRDTYWRTIEAKQQTRDSHERLF